MVALSGTGNSVPGADGETLQGLLKVFNLNFH